MNKYRLSITIEDEVIAETHYEAYLKFRDRWTCGFYSPRQQDVEFIEEVPSAEETTESE